MIDKETYRELYRKLDEVFPVPYDCGTICGKACCGVAEYNRATRDEDMGLYLYPGEDELLKEDADWLNWSRRRSCRRNSASSAARTRCSATGHTGLSSAGCSRPCHTS